MLEQQVVLSDLSMGPLAGEENVYMNIANTGKTIHKLFIDPDENKGHPPPDPDKALVAERLHSQGPRQGAGGQAMAAQRPQQGQALAEHR
jgi:hypothetical protein